MRTFIRSLSLRSYLIISQGLGLLLAFLFLPQGFTSLELTILIVFFVGCVVFAVSLRTPRQKLVTFNALPAFDQVLAAGRPTLIEFYSDQCALCMANRPLLDRLEQQAGHDLQILRVDAKDNLIGRQLAERYQVTLTPTFLLFNPTGEKRDEYVLIVNRGQVLYYLDQLKRA